MQWYVQVQGQSYGPYTDAQMQGFVVEGRVTANSLISASPAEGYFVASAYDNFAQWSGLGSGLESGLGSDLGREHHLALANGGVVTFGAPAPTVSPTLSSMRALSQDAQPRGHLGYGIEAAVTPRPLETANPEHAPAVFVIMAELRSDDAMAFLKTLQSFGPAERLGDSVWALKGRATPETLRNSLSQTLGRQDRLFIVDATHNKTAWFNIGADLDGRMRRLWDEEV